VVVFGGFVTRCFEEFVCFFVSFSSVNTPTGAPSIPDYKGKGKDHPRTGHEDPEGGVGV